MQLSESNATRIIRRHQIDGHHRYSQGAHARGDQPLTSGRGGGQRQQR